MWALKWEHARGGQLKKMFQRTADPEIFESIVGRFSVRIDEAISWAALEAQGAQLFLEDALPKRKIEFTAGRYCAQQAFRQEGVSLSSPLGILPNRAPAWPEGWVGSITHTRGWAAAVVLRQSEWRGVGIDSEWEMTRQIANEILNQVLRLSEHELYRACLTSKLSWEAYVTLVFSAKESLYKCLNPLVGVYFDYLDAELIEVDFERSAFKIALCKTLPGGFVSGRSLEGKFEITHPYVHTLMGLRASAHQ